MCEASNLQRNKKGDTQSWDHRFVFDSDPVGTRSLPSIRAPKPYISKNGSIVQSVLKTSKKELKSKKKIKNRDEHRELQVVTTSLTPVHKRHIKYNLQKGSKISVRQQGKIKSLSSRARPCSLPLLRDVKNSIPLGMEKSYSARDSTSRASLLQIDVSLDMDTSKEKQKWKEFNEITEDCDTDDHRHLTRLYCIGRGSSAYVYKSVLFPSIQIVADKVVVVASQEKSSQIMRELQSLRTLLNDGSSHPFCKNIVRLLEVYPNPRDGTISICLEYMAGGSLQDVVAAGGCQNEIILAGLARQIISGISFLHSHRHIHRDIKPGNILISSCAKGSDIVKISDFGISKELEKGHSLADSFLGTFHYMSPERIAGKDYSFSSDIWGCGLSILAVVMGCYPFSKRTTEKSHEIPVGRKKVGREVDRGLRQKNVEAKGEQDHSGGYWHILQAISQRPSIQKLLGGDIKYSSQFHKFLSSSLHRDKDRRASADELLSHYFLSSNANFDEENAALANWATLCSVAYREKNSACMNNAHSLPVVNKYSSDSRSNSDEIHLKNVQVVLGIEGKLNEDANSSWQYVSYNKSCAKEMEYFCVLLLAYNDFALKNWGVYNSEEDAAAHSSDHSRLHALHFLLDSTLSMESCVKPKSSDEDFVNLSTVSPFAPLFNFDTIQILSDQLHIPINIVKLCLRDFVIGLLKLETKRCVSPSENIEHEKNLDMFTKDSQHCPLQVAVRESIESLAQCNFNDNNRERSVGCENVVCDSLCNKELTSTPTFPKLMAGTTDSAVSQRKTVIPDIGSVTDEDVTVADILECQSVFNHIDGDEICKNLPSEELYEDDFDD